MGVAAGVTLGEIGEAGKLPVVENAVGDAQPAHIGFLRWRAVKQAEETPAKIVVGFRRFVLGGLILQPLISIERIELALEFLRIGELAAGFDRPVLRAQSRRVGPDRLRRRCGAVRPGGGKRRRPVATCRTQSLGDLQSGHQAFEIALLLWFEIARHCLFRLKTSVKRCASRFPHPGLVYSAGTPVGVGAKTLTTVRGL